jgi:anti-repressor protein
MNQLHIFKNSDFGEIRTLAIDNEPWFVGRDVAEILGYKNISDTLTKHVDSEDKGVAKCDTLGGLQDMTIINESGLYSLVLSSKMPEAKKFKRWVTTEILPAIRKHGAYMIDSVLEQAVSDPDFMIGLLTNLKDEKEKRQLAEETNEKNKPKVLMAETMLASKESKDVGILSTKLQEMGIKNMGRNNLYKYFRDHGYVIKSGERRNLPTQRSIDLGIMDTDTRPYFRNDEIFYEDKTKITPKGFEYFINKFNQEGM